MESAEVFATSGTALDRDFEALMAYVLGHAVHFRLALQPVKHGVCRSICHVRYGTGS